MSNVRYETDGPVAIVTIDRPEVRNAVDSTTADALAEIFREFDGDDNLSVAVLTGTDGTFCAGADLKAITLGQGNRVVEEGDGPLGISRFLLSKPTIAAVEGYAVAGGLELSLWCDLRVAAEDAVFGVFCRRWGVPLMDGGTVRLARLIGHSHALDMILTGRQVSGPEALRMGLANRLVPKGATRDAAIALARDIAKHPQVCMRSDRLSSYEQWNLPLADALRNEFHRGMDVVRSGAMFGGLERFTKTIGHQGSLRHVALGTPMMPPFPDGMETALFGMGRFWIAERRFWQTAGVYTTAVGHADGIEVVRVVFDPGKTSYEALLRVFWQGHDPTARPSDAAHRSTIFHGSAEQRQMAEGSRDVYQRALSKAGGGKILTEIRTAAEFNYAADEQQQYLEKHPEHHVETGPPTIKYPDGR